MVESTYRFAADRTLGKLARRLRMLGFDTLCECELPRRRFEAMIDTHRIFLTRNRRKSAEPVPYRKLFIGSDRPDDQVIEVLRALRIQAEEIHPFRRCLFCNLPIEEVERNHVLGLVPDYTWETRERFTRCPRCQRIYWRGSHTERALREMTVWIQRAGEGSLQKAEDQGPEPGFSAGDRKPRP